MATRVQQTVNQMAKQIDAMIDIADGELRKAGYDPGEARDNTGKWSGGGGGGIAETSQRIRDKKKQVKDTFARLRGEIGRSSSQSRDTFERDMRRQTSRPREK